MVLSRNSQMETAQVSSSMFATEVTIEVPWGRVAGKPRVLCIYNVGFS